MSNLGLGVMIHHIFGGTEHEPSEYYGRKITAAELIDNRLRLTLDGGKQIEIWDDGQSCCEHRYITTDDDLSSLVGGVLNRIECRDGATVRGEYDEHEIAFVEVGTDKAFITLTTHNQHNGYYGGFGLTITERSTEQ